MAVYQQQNLTPIAHNKFKPIVLLCDKLIRWTLLSLTFLLPLFFLPWTTEVAETNKQLLLFVGAAVAVLAWLGRMLAEGRFVYRRTIINTIVFLFLIVYAVSAWLSENRYLSLVGDFGQEKAGLTTMVAFVIIYFVAASNITTEKMLRKMADTLILSGLVVAIFALLQSLGVFVLPFVFARTAAFSPVGTVTSLGLFLAFVVMLASGALLSHQKNQQHAHRQSFYKSFLVVTAVLCLVLIAAIDYWPISVCLLVASAILIVYSFLHARSLPGLGGVILPIIALVVSVLLLVFRVPAILHFPLEVMPSFKATFEVTKQTLRDHSFFGSGPGTFLYDYAKFKPVGVNTSSFWHTRFDRGDVRFLTMLSTGGLLGALTWLLLALVVIVAAGKKLLRTDERTWHVLIGMFVAWFLLVISKFVYSSTMTLEFVFWVTLAMLVVTFEHDFFSVQFSESPRLGMAASFLFILGVVFSLAGFYAEGQRYLAEINYARAVAVNAAGGSVDQVIEKLAAAQSLNQRNDVYARNLAAAFMSKANQLITAPLGLIKNAGESAKDFSARQQVEQTNRLRTMSSLTSGALAAAKRATELNPADGENWAALAVVYQNMIGLTEDADKWAVQSYESAIEREPSNPAFLTGLGDVYLAQAKVFSKGSGKNLNLLKETQTQIAETLDKAVETYNQAVALKADYGPARFGLALALEQQGKLTEAITNMERAVTSNPRDIGTAFQLALLYYRNNQKTKAVELLQTIISLAPGYSNAHWYLGLIDEERGQIDQAIEEISRVQQQNPGNDLVNQKLTALKAKQAGAAGPAATPASLPLPIAQPAVNATH